VQHRKKFVPTMDNGRMIGPYPGDKDRPSQGLGRPGQGPGRLGQGPGRLGQGPSGML